LATAKADSIRFQQKGARIEGGFRLSASGFRVELASAACEIAEAE